MLRANVEKLAPILHAAQLKPKAAAVVACGKKHGPLIGVCRATLAILPDDQPRPRLDFRTGEDVSTARRR